MTASVLRGGCRCGVVRFTLKGAPTGVGVCHCESCKRATGGAFATFVDAANAQVTIEGDVAAYSSRPGIERLFCAACGSPIAYRDTVSERPGTALHLGAFDDPTGLIPDNATYAEEGFDWALKALGPLMIKEH